MYGKGWLCIMGKPESKIETYLIKRAKKEGFFQCKFTSPGTDGVPDRMLIGYGYTFFIETKKSENENPRRLQKVMINDMINHGGYVYVAGTKEEVDEILSSIKNGKPKKPEKQI